MGRQTESVTLGVILGLVLGKPLGITLAAWLAVRAGIAATPEGVSWRQLHGAGWLGGIGFTMSLFIASLAFGEGPLLTMAKLGILSASLIAGLTGWVLLRTQAPCAARRSGHGSRPRAPGPADHAVRSHLAALGLVTPAMSARAMTGGSCASAGRRLGG